MLWERIPGWTSKDTEDAKKILEAQRQADMLMQELALGATPGGAAPGADNLTEDEVKRRNRLAGGRGPDWDKDGKPN
jgi:hypothetical protein